MVFGNAPSYRHLFSYIRTIRARIKLFAGLVFVAIGLGLADSLFNFIGSSDSSHTTPATAFGLFVIAASLITFRWLEPSPRWKWVLSGLVIASCLLRVLQGLIPGFPLDVEGWLSPAPDGLFSGKFGFESALFIGCIVGAGMFRRSRTRIGELLIAIAASTILFDVLQLLYRQQVFGGQTGRFTLLADIGAVLGMSAIYATRRYYRVLFLRSWIGYHTRLISAAIVGQVSLFGWLFVVWSGAPERSVEVITILMAALIGLLFFSVMHLANLHNASDGARRRMERELERLSRTDALTGVLNRKGAVDWLEEAWTSYKAGGQRFGVILVDLDHFKRINDVYGHSAGDHVLSSVGRALRGAVRPEDMVGRWGGEEFLILVSLDQGGSLMGLAERLRAAIEAVPEQVASPNLNMNGSDFPPCPITGSVGVTEFLPGDESADATLERADRGLYEAKAEGRNRVVVADRAA